MRTTTILVVGCALVLGGAFFASRMLVSEVPPPSQVNVLTMVSPLPEVSAAPPATAPAPLSPDRAAQEAAMTAPHQGLLQPVKPVAAPGFPRAVEAPTAAPADLAKSPFRGESKELDYAELLLTDPTPDPEKLRSAYDVMSRCTEQEPDNQRCEAGLALAKKLLFAPTTTELKPRPPTLVPQAPQMPRPALHPK